MNIYINLLNQTASLLLIFFFRNCNNLKKSTFTTNNLNLFGQEDEERIIDKVNYFKVRLNLLSMK